MSQPSAAERIRAKIAEKHETTPDKVVFVGEPGEGPDYISAVTIAPVEGGMYMLYTSTDQLLLLRVAGAEEK